MPRIEVVSPAETDAAELGPLTVALESTWALVAFDITSMTAEPATPAESPPAPLTAISSMFSLWLALTERPDPPLDWTSACW